MPEHGAAEIGVYAVYLTSKQLPLKVRRLVDYLVECILDVSWGARAARTQALSFAAHPMILRKAHQ